VEPTVLLLDEPFGALDAKVRKELRDWLRRLHDEVHVTTVFVTHDQEEALEVADEIVVINDGRIEQVGSPDELYDEPANPFVMSFLGPVTRFGDRLVRPHDLHLVRGEGTSDVVTGQVTRLTRVGFEVRAEVRLDDQVESVVLVTLTRTEARSLGLADGVAVGVYVAPGAPTVAVAAPGNADPVAPALANR
jgi:sulfate transport system ATP-binding protein